MDLMLRYISPRQFFYLVSICVAIFATQAYIPHSQFPWIVWSGLIVCFVAVGDSFKQRIAVVVLTGLALGAAIFLAGIAAPLFLLNFICLIFLLMVCVIIGHIHHHYLYSALSVAVFAIVAAGLPVNLEDNVERLYCVEVGVLLAVVVQFVLYPYYLSSELKASLVAVLYHLQQLNKEIFACFLESDYPDNVYLFERRIHIQKNAFMQEFLRVKALEGVARRSLRPKEQLNFSFVTSKINMLYHNAMDYSLLRRRVTDHATFNVCDKELNGISLAISQSIDTIMRRINGRKSTYSANQLTAQIGGLEDNYNNILQIAAREPLVFLLFIDSLKAFSHTLDALSEFDLPLIENNRLKSG